MDDEQTHLTPKRTAAIKIEMLFPSHLCSYTPPHSAVAFCTTGVVRIEKKTTEGEGDDYTQKQRHHLGSCDKDRTASEE